MPRIATSPDKFFTSAGADFEAFDGETKMTPKKTFESRVLPELQPGLDFFKIAFGVIRDFDRGSMDAIRAHLDPYFEAGVAAAPRYDDIAITERTVESTDGQGALKLRLYHPKSAQGLLPCLYWIHGGGMVVGATRYDDPDCSHYARELNCVVVSVEYRLAPEHPYPEGVEDCYQGLKWLAGAAASVGVDPARIAVGGRSGGGILAAATVLIARDRGGPAICYQLLIYPMLDDRNLTPSAVEFADVPSWGGRMNIAAWKAVLGARAGTADVPYHAAPARATDLSGLPPALMQVGELEVFRDECIDYASRLLKAGVPCELHVHPGCYHASDMFNPGAPSTRRMSNERISALQRAFAVT